MSDAPTLLDAESNLDDALAVLAFLPGSNPHPRTDMGEHGGHGNQLILFQIRGLLLEAKAAVQLRRAQD